jgi:NAD(P)-dependent dehydrogenase (short-subunit alcohol dehydrogenase family)
MAQALTEAGISGIAILDYMTDAGLLTTEQLSNDTGVDARFYQVDISDQTIVKHAISNVMSHYGKIDILINSAGIAEWVLLTCSVTIEDVC